MVLFEIFGSKKLIQIYTKTHQIAPFKKKFSGGKTPKPPNKEHGFAICGACREATCRFPNLKKFLAPLPNPGDAPVHPEYISHKFQ